MSQPLKPEQTIPSPQSFQVTDRIKRVKVRFDFIEQSAVLINLCFYQKYPSLVICPLSPQVIQLSSDNSLNFCAGICKEGKALPVVYSTVSMKRSELFDGL